LSVVHAVAFFFTTLICLAGFIRRPRAAFELLRPRFVIPALVWIGTLGQDIYFALGGPETYDVFSRARLYFATNAVFYTGLSMAVFFIGFASPMYRWFDRLFPTFEFVANPDPVTFRRYGYIASVMVFVLLILTSGTGFLGGEVSGVTLPEDIGRLIRTFSQVLIMLGAALLGMGFPDRGFRSPLTYIATSFSTFLLALPYMAQFSRGTGLPLLITYVAYAIRVQRLSIIKLLLVVAWAGWAAEAGFTGRGIYGHYAGVPDYFRAMFTDAKLSNVVDRLFFAQDAYSSLCVSFAATETDIRRLTIGQWIFSQIPIPRIRGIHPEWTPTLTYYVGGVGSWGYTEGMLGDTYNHFGWFGMLWFFIPGVAYRLVDHLCFGRGAGRAVSVSPYFVLLCSSYFAMLIGLFNNFRSWIVAFFFVLYLIWGVAVLFRMMVPHQPQQPYHGEPSDLETYWQQYPNQ
jgi:hypothetical protein